MAGVEVGIVADPPTGERGPAEEIDIFEPQRKETFIKPPQRIPGDAADEEACARGLVDEGGEIRVEIERPPAAVDRV